MGNCVSCADRSNDHELRVKEEDRRNSELQVPSTFNSSFKTRTDYSNSGLLEGVANGSRHSTSSNHHVNSSDLSASQKSEKKNAFYSRIPPLGRTVSDKDKKLSQAQLNASITDNNNAYSENSYQKLSALFEYYKESNTDSILAEGIERLCRDLELKPEDFRVLVLAWKCGCEEMCKFTRNEFVQGMRALKTDTIDGMKIALSDISNDMKLYDKDFKDLYRFAFKFALDSEIGQRILDVNMAASLWRVVFYSREPPILERWLEFLESSQPCLRGIPGDTWNMFLNFVETYSSDLSDYDDSEAWPSLFDDFVEYENDKLNQNITNLENSSSIILCSKDQPQTQTKEVESQQ